MKGEAITGGGSKEVGPVKVGRKSPRKPGPEWQLDHWELATGGSRRHSDVSQGVSALSLWYC